MSGAAIPIIIIAAILAVVGAIFGQMQAKKRREELAALAARLGLRFDPHKDRSHDDRYANFEIFRRGHSRAAFNTMIGSFEMAGAPHSLVMGDFVYKVTRNTGKSSSTTTYRFSYLILHLPYARVPDLLIRSEHFFDKLGGMLGFDDIDFESAEFSRKFMVKSADKRFAYDVITPAMMEFLLARRGAPAIDIERGMLCLADGRRRWSPDQFTSMLSFAASFMELWPEHVIRDLQAGARA